MNAGKHSFNNQSLHHIGASYNPYEQAISIIGRTLSPFDDDDLIPCFGFGDGNFFFNYGHFNVFFLRVMMILRNLKN